MRFLKKVSKILSVIIVVLCFASCGKLASPPLPSLYFKSTATVVYKEYTIKCTIQNTQEGVCTIEIIEPKELNGLKIIYKDNTCSVKMGSLSFSKDLSEIPQTAFGSALMDCLNKLMTTENLFYSKNDDGNWLWKGTVAAGEFEVLQDGKTGYPLSVEIKNIDLKITFSDTQKI